MNPQTNQQYTTTGAAPGYGTETVRRDVVHTGHGPDNDTINAKNRVQWGPIIAGVLSAIAILLILTILGVAIGTSALEPRDVNSSLGTGAAIWGAISAIIAFFVGGYVAAKTAAVGGVGSGMINGLMVGAAILAIILYLTGSGIGSIVGTLGSNIGDLTNVAQGQTGTNPVDAAQAQASQVSATDAFNAAKDSSWGTLIGIVLALVAAGLGGIVGHNTRRDLVATA